MDFRTKIDIPKSSFGISHNDKCIFVGSCFAENIGDKLAETKIPTSVNPTGILYNPLSICKSIKNALSGREYNDNDVFPSGGTWNCFDFHSRFSNPDKATCIENLNEATKTFANEIRRANVMFVTFGTAFVYEHAESWSECIKTLTEANPNLRIIFTVSPIRHWRDGAHQNQISKSTLHLAINELNAKFGSTFYFPAYEIVMDELRDYRFYATDMVHPSETAVQYIWERFSETFFSEQTKSAIAWISKITAAANHRPANPQSDAYKAFCNHNLAEIERIKEEIGAIDFSEEEEKFGRFA